MRLILDPDAHRTTRDNADITNYRIWACIFFFLLEIRKTHRYYKSLRFEVAHDSFTPGCFFVELKFNSLYYYILAIDLFAKSTIMSLVSMK